MFETGYRAQKPPSTIVPLGPSFRWRSDIVDYALHPAYASFVREARPVARLAALAAYSGAFAALLLKRAIRFEMIPAEYRKGRSLAKRLGFMRQALANLLIRSDRRAKYSPSTDRARRLTQDGVAVVEMTQNRREMLLGLAAPHFRALEARRAVGADRREFKESRAVADRASDPALFALIEQIFVEAGLTDAADAYLGRRSRLVDVNPQINDPSDSFWRDIFEDVPGASSPVTAYCHRDASGGDLKVIIYCSDVDAKRGPFSYAVGSNTMTISATDDLLCEANDHNGLSATSLEARRRFAALPAKLRQKGSFGNDLDPASPQAAAIIDSLWSIEGPVGSMVAFDTKGIHRGGMVIEGERRVLTCVLG